MILWFAGVSMAFVFLVFRSPALDYRLVALGSVLPLGDVLLGGPRVLHALVGAVALLTVIMLATRGRRLVRRRLIGLPIGVMMHLVLDGIWANSTVFWWPFFGWGFGPEAVPEVSRGVAVTLVLEALGAAALAWCWVTFGWSDPERRRLFLRTGHLSRDLVG